MGEERRHRMDQNNIRNFCIIAHIDHGKSTLADRFLEITKTVDARKMKSQVLDTMELEQERGITIKLQPARMQYLHDGHTYQLNLIDTPGHVDFQYEVSRSLAAVEGAILLVDATQGVQAQTLANLHLAIAQDLVIIPVLNKIDLPAADVETRSRELMNLIGCSREEILMASGKTGEGVEEILRRVIRQVPPPAGNPNAPLRALIFDSFYDSYRGVVAYVRVVDGTLPKNRDIRFWATGADGGAMEVGALTPVQVPAPVLSAGQIGYVVTARKDIGSVRIGDTVTVPGANIVPLPGYKDVSPMVYAGVFPREGDDEAHLRDAVEKLRLNDAAFTAAPERSAALGLGFRCGFLGMLHLEIIQERLRREYGLDVVVTTPSVAYEATLTDGEDAVIHSPLDFPDASRLLEAREPWVSVEIVCPASMQGNVMALVAERRGQFRHSEYLEPTRVLLRYDMPLSSVIVDFYDKLKGATSGYASLNYTMAGYRPAPIVRMDILVAEEPVAAFALLIHRDEAYARGKEIVETLKEILPRQQFVLKIQAAIGAKVIASERLSAFRKDVTAKLYGGDVTRKNKLLKKQKKGKAKMLAMGAGKVDIPSDAFLKVLRRT